MKVERRRGKIVSGRFWPFADRLVSGGGIIKTDNPCHVADHLRETDRTGQDRITIDSATALKRFAGASTGFVKGAPTMSEGDYRDLLKASVRAASPPGADAGE